MRIKSVDTYKADIPLRELFRISLKEIRVAENVFIKINTNEEIYSIGE